MKCDHSAMTYLHKIWWKYRNNVQTPAQRVRNTYLHMPHTGINILELANILEAHFRPPFRWEWTRWYFEASDWTPGSHSVTVSHTNCFTSHENTSAMCKLWNNHHRCCGCWCKLSTNPHRPTIIAAAYHQCHLQIWSIVFFVFFISFFLIIISGFVSMFLPRVLLVKSATTEQQNKVVYFQYGK